MQVEHGAVICHYLAQRIKMLRHQALGLGGTPVADGVTLLVVQGACKLAQGCRGGCRRRSLGLGARRVLVNALVVGFGQRHLGAAGQTKRAQALGGDAVGLGRPTLLAQPAGQAIHRARVQGDASRGVHAGAQALHVLAPQAHRLDGLGAVCRLGHGDSCRDGVANGCTCGKAVLARSRRVTDRRGKRRVPGTKRQRHRRVGTLCPAEVEVSGVLAGSLLHGHAWLAPQLAAYAVQTAGRHLYVGVVVVKAGHQLLALYVAPGQGNRRLRAGLGSVAGLVNLQGLHRQRMGLFLQLARTLLRAIERLVRGISQLAGKQCVSGGAIVCLRIATALVNEAQATVKHVGVAPLGRIDVAVQRQRAHQGDAQHGNKLVLDEAVGGVRGIDRHLGRGSSLCIGQGAA